MLDYGWYFDVFVPFSTLATHFRGTDVVQGHSCGLILTVVKDTVTPLTALVEQHVAVILLNFILVLTDRQVFSTPQPSGNQRLKFITVSC